MDPPELREAAEDERICRWDRSQLSARMYKRDTLSSDADAERGF